MTQTDNPDEDEENEVNRNANFLNKRIFIVRLV